MRSRVFLCLLAVTGLASCDKFTGSASSCTSEDAKSVTVSLIKDQIIKLVKVRNSDGSEQLSSSKVRAALSELQLSLDDIRTSKNDPNSTKKFCMGTIKLVAPANVVTDAEEARQLAGEGTLTALADASDVEANANVFTAPLEFNVQPTDDGQKIFASLENGTSALKFFAELVVDDLLYSTVRDAKAQEQQQQQAQAAAQQSALAEQQAANLEEAKTENKLATQNINAVWAGIPSSTRGQMLNLQRAWGRKRNADCRVEASTTSTDPAEVELNRLKCDTRMQNERASALRPYMESGAVSETPIDGSANAM